MGLGALVWVGMVRFQAIGSPSPVRICTYQVDCFQLERAQRRFEALRGRESLRNGHQHLDFNCTAMPYHAAGVRQERTSRLSRSIVCPHGST
jgi:hypothetical protein